MSPDAIKLQTCDDMTLRALALCENMTCMPKLHALLKGSTGQSILNDLVALSTLANALMDRVAVLTGENEVAFRETLRSQVLATYGEELAC